MIEKIVDFLQIAEKLECEYRLTRMSDGKNQAVALSEPSDTIEDVIEPYLMQLGVVQRTPRGRVITEAGYAYLGLEK